MKGNISLKKKRIKIKGSGRVIIPLDPREVKPSNELDDEDADVRRLYQIMKNNEDTIEPKNNG